VREGGLLPVAEANAGARKGKGLVKRERLRRVSDEPVVAGSSSKVDDETKDDETGEDNDLEEGEPELDLAEDLDTKHVDRDD
jgi:hypothetical protein